MPSVSRQYAGLGVKWRLSVRCDGLRAKTHAQSTPRLDQYKRRSKLKHNEKVSAGLYLITDVFQTSEIAHFVIVNSWSECTLWTYVTWNCDRDIVLCDNDNAVIEKYFMVT